MQFYPVPMGATSRFLHMNRQNTTLPDQFCKRVALPFEKIAFAGRRRAQRETAFGGDLRRKCCTTAGGSELPKGVVGLQAGTGGSIRNSEGGRTFSEGVLKNFGGLNQPNTRHFREAGTPWVLRRLDIAPRLHEKDDQFSTVFQGCRCAEAQQKRSLPK